MTNAFGATSLSSTLRAEVATFPPQRGSEGSSLPPRSSLLPPKRALRAIIFGAMGGLSDDERQPLGGGKTANSCGPSLVRVILIESVIYLLWAILEIVNAVLKVLELMYRSFDACAGLLKPNDSPKHVVIVGASFGGLAAQRELAGRRDVKVTLIDFKSYFEYTPGVPPSPRASSRLFRYPL